MKKRYFFTLLISAWIVTSSVNAAQELVLHLTFDELAGKVAKDRSPFGNDATFKGQVKLIKGKFGQALELDGKSAGQIPDHPSLDVVDAVTIEFWTIVNAGDAIQSGVEKGNAWVPGEYNLAALYNGGTILQFFDLPDGCNDENVGPSIQDGKWHFLVGTWDGKEIKLYIDGELEAEMPCKGKLNPNNDPLHIGARGGNERFLNGALDEIKMYNYALTREEILKDMEEPVAQAVDAKDKLTVTWGQLKAKF
jgi:hypothetical protein